MADNLGYTPGAGATASLRGTSDLAFCTKLMEDKIFEKAGWPEFQKKKPSRKPTGKWGK